MSQACVSALFVLPVFGNNKVQSWGGFQWGNIFSKFHQNSSCNFPGEACRQTDMVSPIGIYIMNIMQKMDKSHEKNYIHHTFNYKWWCCWVFLVNITAEGNDS
jgi:hypothetical protein